MTVINILHVYEIDNIRTKIGCLPFQSIPLPRIKYNHLLNIALLRTLSNDPIQNGKTSCGIQIGCFLFAFAFTVTVIR